MIDSFAVGDKVTWTSQAGGYRRSKFGTVVAVIDPRKTPQDYGLSVRDIGLMGRSKVSYVVDVGKRRPRLMWPRTLHLRRSAL